MPIAWLEPVRQPVYHFAQRQRRHASPPLFYQSPHHHRLDDPLAWPVAYHVGSLQSHWLGQVFPHKQSHWQIAYKRYGPFQMQSLAWTDDVPVYAATQPQHHGFVPVLYAWPCSMYPYLIYAKVQDRDHRHYNG